MVEDEHRSGIRCTRVLLVAVDARGVGLQIVAGLARGERASPSPLRENVPPNWKPTSGPPVFDDFR